MNAIHGQLNMANLQQRNIASSLQSGHSEENSRDQTRHADDVCFALDGLVQDGLAGHHDADVHNLRTCDVPATILMSMRSVMFKTLVSLSTNDTHDAFACSSCFAKKLDLSHRSPFHLFNIA